MQNLYQNILIAKKNRQKLLAILIDPEKVSIEQAIVLSEKIKNIYPEVHNCEHYVTEDKYFSSCGHMNEAGARVFTAKIIEDFFSTKLE